MGIHEREYYRDDQPTGFKLGARSMVINLVIINVAVYLFCLFSSDNTGASWAQDQLALRPDVLLKPWLWWKFITYGFAHDHRSAWHIVGNMFGLWIFGRGVEEKYGGLELLRLYFVTVVLGGVAWAAREHYFGQANPSLVGASGAVTAIVVLFCLAFPTRTILFNLFIPIPAWVLGVIVVLGDIGGAMSVTGQPIAFDVHLFGAAFAFLYFWFGWNLGAISPRPISIGKIFKPKPKLRVHVPDSDPDAEDFYDELDRRGDAVLAKLHREGEESLSKEEQRILKDYSRRMKQKLR